MTNHIALTMPDPISVRKLFGRKQETVDSLRPQFKEESISEPCRRGWAAIGSIASSFVEWWRGSNAFNWSRPAASAQRLTDGMRGQIVAFAESQVVPTPGAHGIWSTISADPDTACLQGSTSHRVCALYGAVRHRSRR